MRQGVEALRLYLVERRKRGKPLALSPWEVKREPPPSGSTLVRSVVPVVTHRDTATGVELSFKYFEFTPESARDIIQDPGVV